MRSLEMTIVESAVDAWIVMRSLKMTIVESAVDAWIC